MNITDSFRGAMRRLGGRVFASNVNSSPKRRTVPLPSILNSYSVRTDALPKPTPANLRRFAETPIARKAINTIKDRVAGMGWVIKPRKGRDLAALPQGAEVPLATIAPATAPVIAARGRYGSARKGEGIDLLSELAQVFALPGTWSPLDVNSIDFDPQTGELTLPLLPLALPYDEVEIIYNAGFATVPEPLKHACAQIVKNAQATPALTVKRQWMSKAHLEYFAPSLLDDSVRELLAPYVAQKVA